MFTSYAAQRSLDGSRSAAFSVGAARPVPLSHLEGDEYYQALRSSEPYIAMLREQWHQENPSPVVPFWGEPVSPPPALTLAQQFARRNPFLASWYESASRTAVEYADLLDEREHLQRVYDTLNIDGPCGTFSMTWDDQGMENFAKRLSKQVTFYRGTMNDGFEEFPAFEQAHLLLEAYSLRDSSHVPDFADPLSPRPFHLLNRYGDPIFLVRLLRSVASERLFHAARLANLVSRGRQCYVPDFLVTQHAYRSARNRATLSGLAAYNFSDPFEGCDLIQAIDASVSNPANRRAELMTRLRGFEAVAKETGHAALFITLTCPSRFHPVRSCSNKYATVLNPAWVDSGYLSVRDAHAYLTGVWASVRKAASKSKIPVYGFRFVEPHHSGTPHWHMILFVPFKRANEYRTIFRSRALADNPDEPGANKHRFQCKPLNLKTGSAVGYCSKYIAKNIDGFAVGDDHEAQDKAQATAQRVVAWASANRIRQFQQIGGPSVTVWRELRRFSNQEHENMMTDLTHAEWLLLEACRRAANDGDWHGFCVAMGGIHSKRDDHTMRPHYSTPKAFLKLAAGTLTGKVHPADVAYVFGKSDEARRTQYGDRAQASVDGVMFQQLFIATRYKQFRIVSKEEWEASKQRILDAMRYHFELAVDAHHYFEMQDRQFFEAMSHFEAEDDRLHYFMHEEALHEDWLTR
ncbi:replication endonuclease, partial [Aeromonas sp. R9-1]|uniref:replication endonuclease n=1 Tax=Aeromonas sp. R9-1 TaxID=3138478 RepID=UPI0034A4CDC4